MWGMEPAFPSLLGVYRLPCHTNPSARAPWSLPTFAILDSSTSSPRQNPPCILNGLTLARLVFSRPGPGEAHSKNKVFFSHLTHLLLQANFTQLSLLQGGKSQCSFLRS